jgi:serine/threonine-protein kinase
VTRESGPRRDDSGAADDRLDRAVEAAYLFAAEESEVSALFLIERQHGISSRVLLGGKEDATPAEPAADPARERFTVLREIGRGATGIVFEGRDEELGRPIVLKMLPPEHVHDNAEVRRFLEEAQIGGQLQHPGIVPVYGLGLDTHDRPFFAMQRIEGETLATVLAQRERPAQERERCLEVFLRVCRAVAYAHTSGVVHRDLNPHNVMVGSFGEVHVVDWGLAKLLDRTEGVTDGRTSEAAAYLSPEQAAGRDDEVDERADVFSLGAILCEILTDRPPYVGSRREQLEQAVAGEVGPALDRLRGSEAEGEVIELAVRCLSPTRDDRPRDAGAVARTVSELLSLAEQRARDTEVQAAEERARAEREREDERLAQHKAEAEKRARVWTLVVAAAVVATVSLAVLEFLSLDRANRERADRTHRALTEATRRAEELESAGRLGEAAEWARRAVDLAGTGRAEADARERVTELHARVQAQARVERAAEERARQESELVTRLESFRAHAKVHEPELPSRLHALYASAFRDFGIDMEKLGAEEAAAKLRECGPVQELVTFLDDWSWILRPVVGRECPASDPHLWEKLIEIALLADPDEWRDRFRRIASEGTGKGLRTAAVEAESVDLPARTMAVLARHLRADAPRFAKAVLRRAYLRYPHDYWINRQLSDALRRDESLSHLRAALAARPDDPCTMRDLAERLLGEGDVEAAVALARRSLGLSPAHAAHYDTLAAALWAQSERDEAIRTYRQAIALDPKSGRSHMGLAACLASLAEYEAAAGSYRKAVRLAPGNAEVLRRAAGFFANCADAARRDPELAVALAQRGVEREPAERASYHVYGTALYRVGRYEDAIGMLLKAVQLGGNDGGPVDWYWLAMAHQRSGHAAEAGEWLEKAERAIAGIEPLDDGLAALRAEARAVRETGGAK